MAIVFPASPSVNETFTAGSITYKWDGDKWIGLGVTPADRLVEGSNSLEITASNELQWTGGNVGIGTDPTRPFHLHNTSGSILLVSGTVPQLRFNSDPVDGVDNERAIIGLATGPAQFMGNSVEGDLIIRSESGRDILFGNGTNEKVRIGGGGAGQIGIGTTPTTNAALDVNQGYYSIMYGAVNGANGGRPDNTNKEGRIVQFHRDNEEEPLGAIVTFSQSTASNVNVGGGSSLVNAATETALYAAANATTTGGTKILSATINGVNISLPAAATLTPLTLQNTTSGGDNQVLIRALANGGGDAFIKFDCGGSDMTVGNFYQGTTNNQLCLGPFGTGAATNNGIRIDGNGLVAIGDNATAKLAGELQVINNTESQQTNDCLVYLETVGNDWVMRQNYNSASVISYFNYFLKQGATVGSITYDGTNMIYGTGSDYRLKENVVPLTGAIDTVKLLQPKEFNFISNPDVVVKGFIAHELQEVIPYAVSGEKDGLTRDGEMEPQQVDLSKLVPVLTAALQEALAEIETLKGRLDAAGL